MARFAPVALVDAVTVCGRGVSVHRAAGSLDHPLAPSHGGCLPHPCRRPSRRPRVDLATLLNNGTRAGSHSPRCFLPESHSFFPYQMMMHDVASK